MQNKIDDCGLHKASVTFCVENNDNIFKIMDLIFF